MLRVDVLGPVLVGVHDADPANRDHLRPSGRALVARLALAHGRTVAADQLVDDLWGEELPAHPVAALRVVASRTRKVLGLAARLAFEHGGYRLEAVKLDADRFEEHCRQGRAAVEAGRPAAAAIAFSGGLALWRGDALADVRSAPFTVPEVARLDAARLAALDQRIAADLGAGHHQQLVGELAALVGRYPLQERLWAHRMVALYRDGRQADALRAYDEVRVMLAEQLGLEPGPALRDLQQAVLLQDPRLDPPRVQAGAATEPALPAAATAEPGTATAAEAGAGSATAAEAAVGSAAVAVGPERGPFHRSPLIGRRDEVDSAVRALGSHRLVSFIGPAGVGKSRLAAEVAGLWSAELSPVRFLELSPLDGQDAIVEALAACAGVTLAGQGDALQAVLTRLRDERGLLVLDCCEHVREDAAAVAEQVVTNTSLTVLVTSRTPLLVDGEVRLRIDPLPIDAAVALFGARCGGLAASDRGAAIAVCEAVDRLPLAVELAAGLARALTVDEVAARIGERLQLLTVPPPSAPPHHRTLRAALEWGHDLLAEQDRTLYRRLAVFSGGWTLRAAEATCADPALPAGAVAPGLVRLVDASLVMISVRDGRRRFAMLDTMRELAAEQLEASHDVDTVRAQHLRWCRELVADAEGGDGSELEREHANLRAAVERQLGTERAAAAAELLLEVQRSWLMQGHLAESRRLLLELAADESLPDAVRASLYGHAGNHGVHAGRLREAERALDLGLPLARSSGDSFVLAENRYHRGLVHLQRGRTQAAGDAFSEVLAIMRRLDRRSGISAALDCLADVADLRGDHPSAARHRDAAEAIDRELGEEDRLATGLARRAVGAVFAGDLVEAGRAADEAVVISRRVGSPMLTAWAMESAGRLATARHDPAAARAAHDEALLAYADIGTEHDRCAVHLDLAAAAHDAGDRAAAVHHLAIGLPVLTAAGVDRFVADGLDLAAALLAADGAVELAVAVAASTAGFRRAHGLVPAAAAAARARRWTAMAGRSDDARPPGGGEPGWTLAEAATTALAALAGGEDGGWTTPVRGDRAARLGG